MNPRFSTGQAISTLTGLIKGCLSEAELASLSPSDWDELIRLANAQGVGPILYGTLSRSGKFASLPEAAKNGLRAEYASAWMANRKILHELEILGGKFAEADIPLVVLKGACYALTIYADMAMRPMGDLDVLVPAERFTDALQIVHSMGYAETYPEASAGLTELLNHEVSLRRAGSESVTLELHHSLVADRTYTYAVPMDWFWEQTEPLTGPRAPTSATLRMLTPTAQVLYAAAHAMLQHGSRNAPLRWFVDMDLLINSYKSRLDWDLLVEQARKFEWGSALDVALAQTRTYFDTLMPETVLNQLSTRPDRHRKLVEGKKVRPATHVLEEWEKLRTLNRYGKLRLFTALVAPAPAYMVWRYRLKSSWLLPYYYPYRWWGILKDTAVTFLHLFRKVQRIKVPADVYPERLS